MREKDPMAEFVASALVFIWLPAVSGAASMHSWSLVLGALLVTFYSFIFYFMGEHTARVIAYRQGQARCDECRREVVEHVQKEYIKKQQNPE